MNTLTWDELLGHARLIDEAALATRGIDRFCSSSAWVLPAAGTLTPPRSILVAEMESAIFVGGLSVLGDGTEALCPLEMAWGLSCPVLGPQPRIVTALVREVLQRPLPWHVAIITGIDLTAHHGKAVARGMSAVGQVRMGGEPTMRWRASLGGGFDGYLSRRSRNFRRAMTRAARRAAAAGVEFEIVDGKDAAQARAAYARALAVEKKTWKHAEGVGLIGTPMERFYEDMVMRLGDQGAHRQIIARVGDDDVGYILGGVFGDTYRGLQFGYAQGVRAMSLGGLMQLQTIAQLCDEGVQVYDLGTDLEYKRRWAEECFETIALLIIRGG